MDTRKIASEYRLTHWTRIMQERKESGLGIKEYCKNAGFHENVYYYWQRKLRETACERLAEAKISSLTPSNFAEVMVRETPAQSSQERTHLHIEIAGVQITADSAYPTEKLAALLRELIKGKRDYKTLKWLEQMRKDGHEIHVRLIGGDAMLPVLDRRCGRCNSMVWTSENNEYAYQCFECDEDLYEVETYQEPTVEGTKEDTDLRF